MSQLALLTFSWAPPPHVPSLFGLYAANIGKAHPPQIQPTHVIASIDENKGSAKALGPEQSGGAIGQATGEASADGKFLYTLNDIYDGTAVTARIEKYDLSNGQLVGFYPIPQLLFVEGGTPSPSRSRCRRPRRRPLP